MNIEAVTVSVNYADFLATVAPFNRPLFSRWVIVTTPQDQATREVCRRYGMETVVTDDFTRDDPKGFAKARGINRGLELLSEGSWKLHLDGDMVLPANFLHLLGMAHLDEVNIYGIDRVMVKSRQAWQALLATGFPHNVHEYQHRIQAPPAPLGTRWVSPHYGYVPIGFFQLWNDRATSWRGINHRRYPDKHNNAARCDVQFALQWDRRNRVLLPEVFGVHLESEDAPKGTNWNGRKTRPFDAGTDRYVLTGSVVAS